MHRLSALWALPLQAHCPAAPTTQPAAPPLPPWQALPLPPSSPAAAASAITWDDIFATSYSQANRGSNPDAKAPETPEEYIEQKGNGDIMGSMMVGMVDSLNIPEEPFMNNKPAWPGR